MDKKLDDIKNMMTIEEQVMNKSLEIVKKFLIDNADQKISLTWNGQTLISILQNEMSNVIKEYDEQQKERESGRRKIDLNSQQEKT
jgi:hypothetical protein